MHAATYQGRGLQNRDQTRWLFQPEEREAQDQENVRFDGVREKKHQHGREVNDAAVGEDGGEPVDGGEGGWKIGIGDVESATTDLGDRDQRGG